MRGSTYMSVNNFPCRRSYECLTISILHQTRKQRFTLPFLIFKFPFPLLSKFRIDIRLHNLIKDFSILFSLVYPKLIKCPDIANTSAISEYLQTTCEGFDEDVRWMVDEFGRVSQRGGIGVAKAGGERFDIETEEEFGG
jgi:hypothetical protein